MDEIDFDTRITCPNKEFEISIPIKSIVDLIRLLRENNFIINFGYTTLFKDGQPLLLQRKLEIQNTKIDYNLLDDLIKLFLLSNV